MRRILSVLLENESGALSRVVGLFSQRAFNIVKLNRGTYGRPNSFSYDD